MPSSPLLSISMVWDSVCVKLTRGSSFPVRVMSQFLKAASTILFTACSRFSPYITASSLSETEERMVLVDCWMADSMVVSSARPIPSSPWILNTCDINKCNKRMCTHQCQFSFYSSYWHMSWSLLPHCNHKH